MRIMALDYGSKTVGVAVSDALEIGAYPLETLYRKKEHMLRRTLASIEALVREKGIDCIVLGRPLHMNGREGENVSACERFYAMLTARVSIPVLWQDERLTTVEAGEILAESKIPPKERKKYLDSVSAALILREYMNNREKKNRREVPDGDGE